VVAFFAAGFFSSVAVSFLAFGAAFFSAKQALSRELGSYNPQTHQKQTTN
jgi:hypothetical protein